MKEKRVYQLMIELDEIQPLIWRRIQVPAEISLFELHFVLQLAMGWTNSHLHEYIIDGHYYSCPDDYEDDFREIRDECDYQLQQVLLDVGTGFSYLYDFGDSWEHNVYLEAILDADDCPSSLACLGGARACPPEDVGGEMGYALFLEAINDPGHPEHEDYLIWIGGDFDPEAFNRGKTDLSIKNFQQSELVRIYQRYNSGEIGPELKLYQAISAWMAGLDETQKHTLRELPLRRDAVTLLTYISDNSISGTQSLGNIPLKVIREIAPRFIQHLHLEKKVGDRVQKIRSTNDVWPIYFLQALYETGGLITGGPGRRFYLTLKGLRFLQSEPAVQVWYLLETWWFHMNWLIASPNSIIGDYLPRDFQFIVLYKLLTLPIDEDVQYQNFAEYLIQKCYLTRPIQKVQHVREFLYWDIELMVINILENFGMLQRFDGELLVDRTKIKRLQSITLTRFGKGLLQMLAGGTN